MMPAPGCWRAPMLWGAVEKGRRLWTYGHPKRAVSLRRTTTLLSEQRLRNNDEAGENNLPGASSPSANFFS